MSTYSTASGQGSTSNSGTTLLFLALIGGLVFLFMKSRPKSIPRPLVAPREKTCRHESVKCDTFFFSRIGHAGKAMDVRCKCNLCKRQISAPKK